MNPEKPLWLLDVDGVLNAVDSLSALRRLEAGSHWSDYYEGRAAGYRIMWSPSLIRRITAVHEQGLADIRWLTTWEGRAQTEIAPLLGLPHFELAGQRNERTEGSWWWKLPIAQAAAGQLRTLVWTDDDLSPRGLSRMHAGREAAQWVRDRYLNHRSHALLIHPRDDIGIDPLQMDVIESFLANPLALHPGMPA